MAMHRILLLVELCLLFGLVEGSVRPLREMLFKRFNEGVGSSDTQRWDGVQSRMSSKIKQQYCEFTVPSDTPKMPVDGQSHYIYCDMHHNGLRDSGHSVFSQFVPQLMRGDVTSGNRDDYELTGEFLDSWYVQPQYIFSVASGVKGLCGEKIRVNVGDVIATRIYAGEDGWHLEIGVKGQSPSTLVIKQPFMGLISDYKSWSDTGLDEFECGELHEAWNMNEASYYPSEMSWSVNYCKTAGSACPDDGLKLDFNTNDLCLDHASGGSCANMMDSSIDHNDPNKITFTVRRTGAEMIAV